MAYELRKTAKNEYQLREAAAKGKGKRPIGGSLTPAPEPPILGEFESEEAAAHFALQHEKGNYDWHPFDPQSELDRRRAQLEGNLRS